eukprot:8840241-Alexandrium_andersonii.AAC.1
MELRLLILRMCAPLSTRGHSNVYARAQCCSKGNQRHPGIDAVYRCGEHKLKRTKYSSFAYTVPYMGAHLQKRCCGRVLSSLAHP